MSCQEIHCAWPGLGGGEQGRGEQGGEVSKSRDVQAPKALVWWQWAGGGEVCLSEQVAQGQDWQDFGLWRSLVLPLKVVGMRGGCPAGNKDVG